MTKQELFDSVKGTIIISCQATPGEPLYVKEKSIMYLMARAAKEAGVGTLNYGAFIQNVIDFFLIAICIFAFVKLITRLNKKDTPPPAPAPAPRLCPFCCKEVDKKATRCPHCTSELPEEEKK